MKSLHISSATAILTFLHLFLTLRAQNSVMVPEARGIDVVLATVSLIQGTGIFPDDNRLLRRVAFVESRDGLDGDTFREGYVHCDVCQGIFLVFVFVVVEHYLKQQSKSGTFSIHMHVWRVPLQLKLSYLVF